MKMRLWKYRRQRLRKCGFRGVRVRIPVRFDIDGIGGDPPFSKERRKRGVWVSSVAVLPPPSDEEERRKRGVGGYANRGADARETTETRGGLMNEQYRETGSRGEYRTMFVAGIE